MLFILIFKKLGLKLNKYVLAILYGFFYFFLTLLIFFLVSFKIKRFIISPFLFSLIVGFFMGIFFLFKEEYLILEKDIIIMKGKKKR